MVLKLDNSYRMFYFMVQRQDKQQGATFKLLLAVLYF